MDYEKKYKEANDKVAVRFGTYVAKEIFTDLYESEDEKIRKKLITFFQRFPYTNLYDIDLNAKNVLAWLEKQGKEEYALKSFKDEDVRKFMQYIEKEAKAYEFNLPNRSYDIYAFAKDILVWLEKQGNHNEQNFEEKCKCCEYFDNYDMCLHNKNFGAVTDESKENCRKSNLFIEKQNKHNTDDKVEPKFKVGDWIVATGKCVYLITKIDGFNVTLVDTNGDEYVFHVSSLDDAYQWTIQDAKDGDVIQLGKVTAIFKEFIGNENCRCYCSVYEGDFEIPIEDGEDNIYGCTNAIPATKEQRNILFAKMKEVGYKWDAEKK